ncbi:unnamed protein product [Trifolium pratense]|uniref:Uncharacterized protein n=1 Tax=Trifolium pratense TaxID=57577 RepID=A0ACB0KKQ9_TRIPR|nr:unnamed protein product [Trifolium pratense]
MKNLTEYHHLLVDKCIMTPKPSDSVVRNNICLSPPPSNFLKLNVDAHLSDDGRWAFGMILRRDDGRCVGAEMRICFGTHDAAMAEATGLLEALYWVDRNHLSNTIIEIDGANIVHALNQRVFPRTDWGQVARTGARVLSRLNNVSVTWVNRKGNEAAHELARWALVEPNRS